MCTTLFSNYRLRKPKTTYNTIAINGQDISAFSATSMATAYLPSRPNLRRNTPLSVFNHPHGFNADAPMIQRIDVGDSSDDEIPLPMKFSALTKALLESEAPEPTSPVKEEHVQREEFRRSSPSRYRRDLRQVKSAIDTPSRAPLMKIVRKASPDASAISVGQDQGISSPRIVQVGASAKRNTSINESFRYTARSREGTPVQDFVTPAPAPRAVRISRNRTESNASSGRAGDVSGVRSESRHDTASVERTHEGQESYSSFNRSASAASTDGVTRHAPSTLARSRNTSAESAAPPGSMRVKRVPVGTGSFLRGAPVRRGFRRRDSDENQSANEDNHALSQVSAGHNDMDDPPVRSADHSERVDSANGSTKAVEQISAHDFAQQQEQNRETRPVSTYANQDRSQGSRRPTSRVPSRQSSIEHLPGHSSPPRSQSQADKPSGHAHSYALSDRQSNESIQQAAHQRQSSLSRPSYRPPPPKMYIDTNEDQENMPPPTFKRNKDHDFKYLGKSEKVSVLTVEKHRTVADTPVPVPAHQSPRKALGALSENTPLRPAPPPPPKMTVLDAATKTAGASTTKSKKRRQHILINGKLFTQMNKLGKGGSGDVYCVMAENYKLFALKKVKLEDCDETAVRGFKGEIDLLRKLVDVERVVRLYDWELDESKQTLSVLMEKGDNDFNRILTQSINGLDPKFDPVMTRYYWREMLECVQAVHDYDIVHSDLKPANFLMVQGRLKLIDFGIANAIDTDNTCNVHRESHVGTPNYMSPESITDTNGSSGNGRDAEGRPLKKDMKIGKASDVWSMGCILYQMTYGRPPFAHIPNQISRIMAITNPKVAIEYPERGIGGAIVPASLKGTLRRCLQRDPELRPTAKQLLSESDGFLNPEAGGAVMMSEDLLRQIIDKVVDRCRDPKKGVPTPEEVRTYPGSFMVKIREMVEKG